MTENNGHREFHNRRIVLIAQQNQRMGQASMNALRDVNPEMYQNITGTEADPYYDDDKMGAFRRATGLA